MDKQQQDLAESTIMDALRESDTYDDAGYGHDIAVLMKHLLKHGWTFYPDPANGERS